MSGPSWGKPTGRGWPVLSLKQPWANAVLWLGKRIENRTWSTAYRGEFLIHASKAMTENEYEAACDTCEDVLGVAECFSIEAAFGRGDKPTHKLEFGGIVGRARIVDVVGPREGLLLGGAEQHYPPALRDGGWRWHFCEQYGFVLADVRSTTFVPCKGALGLWTAPPAVIEALELPATP
jgi:hypothetical protein